MYLARVSHDYFLRERRWGALLVPRLLFEPVTDKLLVERSLPAAWLIVLLPARNRELSGVITSSMRMVSPSIWPNSNLVSAMMMPRSRAYLAPRRRGRCSVVAALRPESRQPGWPFDRTRCSRHRRPISALVAGVKIGSGKRSLSSKFAGRRTPQT